MNTTTTSTTIQPRELARRVSGGIEVTLYWSPEDGGTSIRIWKLATEEAVTVGVARERALDAYHHPFAHLPADLGHQGRE